VPASDCIAALSVKADAIPPFSGSEIDPTENSITVSSNSADELLTLQDGFLRNPKEFQAASSDRRTVGAHPSH
jgi:hypothetical protein